MTEAANKSIEQKKEVSAVCGLFCPACTVFIGTQEDPGRIEMITKRSDYTVEDLTCDGCRSARRSKYCRTCKMLKCSEEKGVDFCSECDEYPCDHLKEFQPAMPHRAELWKSLDRISEVGFEDWYDEMVEHYSCPNCHTINSAYDAACRKCKTSPSCAFVELNKEEILKYMSKMKWDK